MDSFETWPGYIQLGPVPAEEECMQVGDVGLPDLIREVRIFKDQLCRMFPGHQFGVKTFPHDFGTYVEVVVYYDEMNFVSEERALEVDENLPSRWDDEARAAHDALMLELASIIN